MKKIETNLTKKQEQLLEDFICYKEEEEVSENTLNMYRVSIRLFLDFTGDEITKRKVLDFKKMLVESKSPKTVNTRLTAVNEFLRRNKMDDLRVKMLKIQQKHFVLNVPNDEEYEKLLKYFLEEKKYKLYWIVRFIAGTGMRVNEITKITYGALKSGYAEIHSKGKERSIMIPKKLIEESRSYFGDKPDENFLFTNRFGEQLTTRGIATVIYENGIKAGIRKEVLHPHAFRHYFAIKLMKATNNNISLVSSVLGHSDLKTTMIYTMLSKEEQEKQMNDFVCW